MASTKSNGNFGVDLDALIYGDPSNIPSYDLGTTEEAIAESKRISASTSDKAYIRLISASNATSYSKLGGLHDCPRSYELSEYEANSPITLANLDTDTAPNVHFAFGHAIGAGIQTYAATRSLVAAKWAGFLAWKAPWDLEGVDGRGNSNYKSLAWAILAIEKFGDFAQRELADWEIVVLPNGRPAVELAFAVDFENGYYHFGHIDVLLKHRISNKLAVWEGKTTGYENINEAMYANSMQALGYSVVADAVAPLIGADSSDYEVLYIVYSAATRRFELLPFGKTRQQRAEWLQDILLDHASIEQYRKLSYFPKRGESCFNGSFKKTCKWFGTCTMSNQALFPSVQVRKITDISEVESVDFKFTLSELIQAQKSKA